MLHYRPIGTPEGDRDCGGLGGSTAAAQVFPFPRLSRVSGVASALALNRKKRYQV